MSAPEKDALRERRQRALDLRDLMKQAAFRRFLYWLLYRVTLVDGASHAGEATHTTAFREGQRDIGIRLGRELRHASLDLFLKMEGEHPSALTVHSETESLGS